MRKYKVLENRKLFRLIDIVGVSRIFWFFLRKSDIDAKRFRMFEGNPHSISAIVIDRISVGDTEDIYEVTTDGKEQLTSDRWSE